MVSHVNSSCHSNCGEALTARMTMSLAFSFDIDWFILEGNSQVVILVFQHPRISQD